MKKTWKVSTTDGREFLSALYRVDSLEEANDILQKLLPIIIEHNAQYDSQISISSKDILVILHGHSTQPLNDSDWKLAHELESFLE